MTKRTQALLGLTGVFLLGGICGALLFGVIVRNHARETHDLRNRDGFLRYFENKLSLTETQRDSIRDELDRTYRDLDMLRKETAEEYNAVIDTLVMRVMPVLTEEQRVVFQTQEQKFRRFMPRGGMRERGPGPKRGRGAGPGFIPSQQMPHDSARVNQSELRSLPPSRQQLLSKSETDGKLKVPSLPPVLLLEKKDSASISEGMSEHPSREEKMLGKLQKRVSALRERLKLTDDQAAAFNDLLTRTHSRVKSLQEEYAGQPILRRQRVGETLQGMDREILELLDENQRQTWTTLRQEMAHKRGKKHRKTPAGAGSQ